MAQPRQRRLAALMVLLSLCCLGGAASAASSTGRQDGAAAATEKAAGQEATRGFTAMTAAEEEVVPARVEMEQVDVQDYPPTESNARHDPGYPRPRGPRHP